MLKLGNLLDTVTGYLPRLKIYAAIAAVWALSLFLARCDAYEDGKRAERATQAKIEAVANKVQNESAGKAAGERETDRGNIADNQKDRDDAITANTEKGAAPSRSRTALNCERMRQAGTDVSHLPACGGRAPGT